MEIKYILRNLNTCFCMTWAATKVSPYQLSCMLLLLRKGRDKSIMNYELNKQTNKLVPIIYA